MHRCSYYSVNDTQQIVSDDDDDDGSIFSQAVYASVMIQLTTSKQLLSIPKTS